MTFCNALDGHDFMQDNRTLQAKPAPPAEETEDCQQDDGAGQGYQHGREAEVVPVDRDDTQHRSHHNTGYECANNTHHDIGEQFFSPADDPTGHPANTNPNHEPDHKVYHFVLYLRSPERFKQCWNLVKLRRLIQKEVGPGLKAFLPITGKRIVGQNDDEGPGPGLLNVL